MSDSLENRFEKEAGSFNKIAKERKQSGRIPDIQKEFFNDYFYNNVWRSSKFIDQHYGESARWLTHHLTKNNIKSVTEFGCGDGWLALELARAGFAVKGVDLSPDSIQIAQSYLQSLKNEKLDLEYSSANILNYSEPINSVVGHGFFHHLPPDILDQSLDLISKQMPKDQILLAVEPRYDQITPLMSLLIYTLRQAWPNHFKYEDIQKNFKKDISDILEELSETDKSQSEMNNESGSKEIEKSLRKYFKNVACEYSNAFYDKVIGSIRVEKKDEEELAILLKKLDKIIVKYNNPLARAVRFIAHNKS